MQYEKYNSTVGDIDPLRPTKYTEDITYNYHLRNVKYMPTNDATMPPNVIPNTEYNNKWNELLLAYKSIPSNFVNDFNSMIVRNDNGYYDMARSKLNYPMENSDVLSVYRNELADYVNLYKRSQDVRKNITNQNLLIDFDKRVNAFTIPRIIELNNIIKKLHRENNVIMVDQIQINNIIISVIAIIWLLMILYTILRNNSNYIKY
jgi:hypothetical protein